MTRHCLLLVLCLTTVKAHYSFRYFRDTASSVWLKTEFGYYFISLTPTEIETAEQTCTSMGGCLHVAGDYINSGCNKTIAGLDIGSYFYSCFIEEVCPPNGYLYNDTCYFLTKDLTWRESLLECNRLQGHMSEDDHNVFTTGTSDSLWTHLHNIKPQCGYKPSGGKLGGTGITLPTNCIESKGVCYRPDDKNECQNFGSCFWSINKTKDWKEVYIDCHKSGGKMVNETKLDQYLQRYTTGSLFWIDALENCSDSSGQANNCQAFDDEKKAKAICKRLVNYQNQGISWVHVGHDSFYISQFEQTYVLAKMFCSVAGGILSVSKLIERKLDCQYKYWIRNANYRVYYRYENRKEKWRKYYSAKIYHKKRFICKKEQEMQLMTPAPSVLTTPTAALPVSTTPTVHTTTKISATTTSSPNTCNNQTGWKMINQMKYYISDVKMDYDMADECCITIGGYMFQYLAVDEKMKSEFLEEGEQYWVQAEDDEHPYLFYNSQTLMWSRDEDDNDTSQKMFICEQETGITRAEIMIKTEAKLYPQGKPFWFKCILDVEATDNSTRHIKIELLKNDITIDNKTVVTTGLRYQTVFKHTDTLVMKDQGIPWKCKAVIDEMILYSKEKIMLPSYTQEELKQKAQAKKDAIKVDKKSTAKYKLKKISAEDKRQPAKVIGYISIIFLSAIALGVITSDACKFYHHYKTGGGLFPLILKRNCKVGETERPLSSQSGRRNSL